MKHILYLSLLTLMIVSHSCKKEYSLEERNGDKSEGSLLSEATGECLPKTVNGAYIGGTTLGASNYIEVDVDVTKEGSYTITTDTINGYYFTASGEFTGTGTNTVKLFGKGKPLAEGSDFFLVAYDSTFCEVEVEVLPSSASGPASFALQTSGTDCMNAVVAGTFTKGTALSSANKVTVDVNVTTIGTYSITTSTVNGIKFSGTGAFTTTGAQTITLIGSGTPINAEKDTIPVTVGSSSCGFSVTVNSAGTQPPPATGTYFWKFTLGGKTYQGNVDINNAEIIDTTVSGFTFKVLYFEATNAAQDTVISLTLADGGGGINANENYASPPSAANTVYFTLDDASGSYETSTTSFTAKVTAHSTSTKVIEGTFSGTIKDISTGTTKTISNGQFKVNYP